MIIEFKKKNFPIHTPFLLKQVHLLLFLTLVLVGTSFYCIDEPLAKLLYTKGAYFQDLFSPIHELLSPHLLLCLLPTLFFLSRFFTQAESRSRRLWLVSLTLPIALLFVYLFALCLGRSDPSWLFAHGESTFRPLQSPLHFHNCPSPLACTFGVLSSSLSYLYPRSSKYIFPSGMLLALSPVLTTSCFLSDALCGSSIGILVSLGVFRMMRKEMAFF
ncbi:MAG: hypothetical protein FJZ58_03315 [Chlamydiae bacterium]|nr:hypothetical protein [Chlamydiota bacterium]